MANRYQALAVDHTALIAAIKAAKDIGEYRRFTCVVRSD